MSNFSQIEGFSLNKLGNFNLKEIQKDSVVWEYTDNAAGDAASAKEEAPKEMPFKRGQVCSPLFLVLPSIFNLLLIVEFMSYSVFLSSFLNYLNYFVAVSFPSLFSPLNRQVMRKGKIQIIESTVIYVVSSVCKVL